MSELLEPTDEVGHGERPLAPKSGAAGVGKYSLLVGGLIGFVGGAAYGTLAFWFAGRTGEPGSIIDVRLLSPVMGVLAGALGAAIGILSGLAAWLAIKLTRSTVGEPQYYLAASLGGVPVTALLSWFLLRNVEPVGFSVASGVGFVTIASCSAILGARLNAWRSLRAAR